MEFKIKNPTEADNEIFEAQYKKYFGQESHKDCAHCNAQKEYEEKRSEMFNKIYKFEDSNVILKQK